MKRYLLDTNIVSNFAKPKPSEYLADWIAAQPNESLHVASLTIAEVRRGILETPRGSRREALEKWYSGPKGPQRMFASRILSFDLRAALVWAELMAKSKAIGRPRSVLDTIVAAVAAANGCVVVTDNARDFEGIETVNPLRGGV